MQTQDDVCSLRMSGSASYGGAAPKAVWDFDEEERYDHSVKIRGSVCLPVHLPSQARLQSF